ncbi:MAG: PAS domain-containing protein, partial [Paludibacter sp.]
KDSYYFLIVQFIISQSLKRKFTKSFDKVDNLKLIHELQVHQIELEMQNEELLKAREQADVAMEKYTDLYDFAPSGYISLSNEGSITDLNFSAATMLGKDRKHLKNTRFGLYVHPDSLELYNQSLAVAFQEKTKKSCELFLISGNDTKICVHIEAIVSENSNLCLLNLIDITERKRLDEELIKKSKQFEDLNRYFLDRELRMIDLKKEINELLIKSGCEKEYLI